MTGERVVRRLAAILAADVVGYSRLMGRDENGTLARLREHRKQRFEPILARHGGRLVKLMGDGAMAEFPSAVDALSAAISFQQAIAEANREQPVDTAIVFRIGLHLGDLIVEGDDLYGDGVNVAARLEAEASPGGILVSRAVREAVDGRLKATLYALGELSLKNIERPIRAFRVEWDAAEWNATAALAPKAVQDELTASAPTTPALALPDKPSIAVLPFQNMSGDPEQEYFADGMVEDITTAIARLPWLFVIARNSSFAYKGKSPDVRQVGRELGVRYVLEGSVRKAGNRVRITGQLIDATNGTHIWADRIDGSLDDIFELHDQVASSVVGAIEPRLRHSEIERAARKPISSLDVYDLYLRALSQFHQLTAEGHREAIQLLRRALALDPESALAASLAGWIRTLQAVQGWVAHTNQEVVEDVRLARLAIERGKDNPDVLWMAGYTVLHLAGEHSIGSAAIDRALVLNPNCAHAWMVSGWVHCFRNRPEPAIEAINRAIRLSPLDPLGYMFTDVLALAHLVAQRYDAALECINRSLSEQPRFLPALRIKVALCGHLGLTKESEAWVSRLLDLHPGLTIRDFEAFASTFFSPEMRAHYVEGLRKAGLPDA